MISDAAHEQDSQVVIASHSEVVLNEAAGRDVVVAFVGAPHRLNDRGTQVLKALKDIGFEDYYLAQQTGWILYLEGSTDLAILQAFAAKLGHPAQDALDSPFVRYVENQPQRARDHFHGISEAKPALHAVGPRRHCGRWQPRDAVPGPPGLAAVRPARKATAGHYGPARGDVAAA